MTDTAPCTSCGATADQLEKLKTLEALEERLRDAVGQSLFLSYWSSCIYDYAQEVREQWEAKIFVQRTALESTRNLLALILTDFLEKEFEKQHPGSQGITDALRN